MPLRYLGLGNEREEFFELTTPLFISNDDNFSLLVPGYEVGPQPAHATAPVP